MDPETEPTPPPALVPPASSGTIQFDNPGLPPKPYHGLKWIFIGADGMRAGWSALIFLALLLLLSGFYGFVFLKLHLIAGFDGAHRAAQHP
jgi:hypothetical protein